MKLEEEKAQKAWIVLIMLFFFFLRNYFQNICAELFEIVNEEINELKKHSNKLKLLDT